VGDRETRAPSAPHSTARRNELLTAASQAIHARRQGQPKPNPLTSAMPTSQPATRSREMGFLNQADSSGQPDNDAVADVTYQWGRNLGAPKSDRDERHPGERCSSSPANRRNRRLHLRHRSGPVRVQLHLRPDTSTNGRFGDEEPERGETGTHRNRNSTGGRRTDHR